LKIRWSRLVLLPLTITVILGGLACAPDQKTNADVAPKLPFGGVNSPASGQTVAGKFDATGWALSEEGIDSVSLYLDGVFLKRCVLGLPRPDVAKVHPGVARSEASGWSGEIDPAGFAAGWHELTIQAKSGRGATRDLASLPILVQR
jgi:hypothetical protein